MSLGGTMGLNLNMNQLIEYGRKLTKSSGEFEVFLKEFLIEMAERIISKTRPNTPKITGTLRGGWKLGDLISDGKNISIEIKNPIEYATEIEYGHRIVRNGAEARWYKGRFMLKTSIDKVRKRMPHRLLRQFNAWCNERGL